MKNVDEIKALVIYAIAHFIFPLHGKPSLLSKLSYSQKSTLYSNLEEFTNSRSLTGDVRGAFLLFSMYSVLHLDIPSISRMTILRGFFFSHIQAESQSDQFKIRVLRIYSLIAESDPSRYGEPHEGIIVVEYCQSSLLVSCPSITLPVTKIWVELMEHLLQNIQPLSPSHLEFLKTEAENLLKDKRCHSITFSILEHVRNLS